MFCVLNYDILVHTRIQLDSKMSINVKYAKICPTKRADHTAWKVVLYFQTTCLRIVKISVPLYFGILYFWHIFSTYPDNTLIHFI